MKVRYPGFKLFWVAMSIICGDILYCLYSFTEIGDRDTAMEIAKLIAAGIGVGLVLHFWYRKLKAMGVSCPEGLKRVAGWNWYLISVAITAGMIPVYLLKCNVKELQPNIAPVLVLTGILILVETIPYIVLKIIVSREEPA